MKSIPLKSIIIIREDFLNGQSRSDVLAGTLGVTIETVNKYRKEFREIQRLYPAKLHDFRFRLPKKPPKKPANPRYIELIDALPDLMENATTCMIGVKALWEDY